MQIDKLDDIFMKQKSLMKRYESIKFLPNFPLNLSEKEDVAHFRNCVFHLIMEIFESVFILKNRPNRKTEIKELDIDSFKEELVDTFHFMIEALILCGIDQNELYDLYCKKNLINNKRIDEQY